MNLASPILGPLAGPECRRALGRGWLIVVRVLAALALMGAFLLILWIWWMNQGADPDFLPFEVLRYGLAVVEGMMVTIALVLGPAVLAGSIAGEKERGVLALLLTTGVGSRAIIVGRLTGKLTQVAMILLAGAPALVALGALAGMGAGQMAVLLALPAVVAIGGGGLAVLASTVSRRGRDALLTVYLLDVFLLLSPMAAMLGRSSGALGWLGVLNPYGCLADLALRDDATPALLAVGLWLALGLLAASAAAWRLRSACLRPLDGDRVLRSGQRRRRVPPLDDDRPMLWKELYIERAAALGGLGWWLGALLVVLLGGGSVVLGGLIVWDVLSGNDMGRAMGLLAVAIGGSATYVGWLIEWAIGLRAAVAISSERERGTWDALLTSPLAGREIVRAKLWGSLHALRWLAAATFLAWTIAAACGAIAWGEYATVVIETVVGAAFMAAVGVRTSLAAPTATRAMATTIGVWLGAIILDTILAAIAIGLFFALLGLVLWIASAGNNLSPRMFVWIVYWAWPVTTNAIYLVATLLIVADTSLRFDRIAGRMTAGRVATSLDRLLHGRPRSPWRRKSAPVSLIGERRSE